MRQADPWGSLSDHSVSSRFSEKTKVEKRSDANLYTFPPVQVNLHAYTTHMHTHACAQVCSHTQIFNTLQSAIDENHEHL